MGIDLPEKKNVVQRVVFDRSIPGNCTGDRNELGSFVWCRLACVNEQILEGSNDHEHYD